MHGRAIALLGCASLKPMGRDPWTRRPWHKRPWHEVARFEGLSTMFGFSLFGPLFFGRRKRSLEVRFRYALERIKCLEEAQKTMADEIEGVKSDLEATNAAVELTNARLDSIAGDLQRQKHDIANLNARIAELETSNPGIDLTELKAVAASLKERAETMALKAASVDEIVPEPEPLTIDHLPLTDGEKPGVVESDEPTMPGDNVPVPPGEGEMTSEVE